MLGAARSVGRAARPFYSGFPFLLLNCGAPSLRFCKSLRSRRGGTTNACAMGFIGGQRWAASYSPSKKRNTAPPQSISVGLAGKLTVRGCRVARADFTIAHEFFHPASPFAISG